LRILPYNKDMRVKSLASALGAVALLAVGTTPTFAQSLPQPGQGNHYPEMTGTVSGPSTTLPGPDRKTLFSITGKDQDTVFNPGLSYIDPVTGQLVVVIPASFDRINNYQHNRSSINVNVEGFELGTVDLWTEQQWEPDGQKRYELSVKVRNEAPASGIGLLVVVYDDLVHEADALHDPSITLQKQVIFMPAP